MRDDDTIPSLEIYRDVAIHNGQGPERVALVKREIDRVLTIDRISALFDLSGDVQQSPEARLLAAAKIEALWERAADERRERPDIDLERVRARVAGLGSRHWRSRRYYASALDVWAPGAPGAAKREEPLERA